MEGDVCMSELRTIEDPKKNIKFWLRALSNPNIDKESIMLLNKCLQSELNWFFDPPTLMVKEERK